MSDQKLFSFRNPWFGASVGITGRACRGRERLPA